MTEFEPLERYLLGRSPQDVRPLEIQFNTLRGDLTAGLKGEKLSARLERLGLRSRDRDRPARGPADRDVRAGVLRVAGHDRARGRRGHPGLDHAAGPGGQGLRQREQVATMEIAGQGQELEHCGRSGGAWRWPSRPASPPRWP